MDNNSHSPLPTQEVKTLNFFDALREVLDGKKITKLEWNNRNIYGVLLAERLCIYIDDKVNDWSISEADMKGIDWIVLSASN